MQAFVFKKLDFTSKEILIMSLFYSYHLRFIFLKFEEDQWVFYFSWFLIFIIYNYLLQLFRVYNQGPFQAYEGQPLHLPLE